MRIAVISPYAKRNGTTTLTILLALEMASRGKKTCIGHVRPISNAFYNYLNFYEFDDRTSTPSQIVKLLKEGELSKDDISDYCKQIANELEAFTNISTNFDEDDMHFMYKYMAKHFPHDIVIFDIDEHDVEKSNEIISLCDVVVVNISQSINALKEFKDNKDSIMKALKGKKIITVVNKFNSIQGTIKEVANWMGVKKPNNWMILHENPWISWATNHGKMCQLFKKMKSNDIRVIELNSEITKICNEIIRAGEVKK